MLTSEPTTLGNVLSVESNLLWTHVHSYIHTSHTPLKIMCLIKIHDQTVPAYLWVNYLAKGEGPIFKDFEHLRPSMWL